MRIPIREQLAGLFLLASLIGLGVISIATWIANHQFVLGVVRQRLMLTASLKAAELASNLNLMQTTADIISTRIVIQAALKAYNYDGDNSAANWEQPKVDMLGAINGQGSLGQSLLHQSIIFPKNADGPAGSRGLLNTTGTNDAWQIKLPYNCANGSQALLGMAGCGYPPALYPNLTYATTADGTQHAIYDGVTIGPGAQDALLIGPYAVNSTFSLLSLTMPMINNTSAADVLAWLTVIMDARLIEQVVDSTEGLKQTGETLLIGPTNKSNIFPGDVWYSTNGGHPPQDFDVRYVTTLNASEGARHPGHTYGEANLPFVANQYPAVDDGITKTTDEEDNSGALIKGHNEAGAPVAAGYAVPLIGFVNWLVVVEQARHEVYNPINDLRTIILACLFGTAGLMCIISWPLAHFAVLPIRRLREATARSIDPPNQSQSSFASFESTRQFDGPDDQDPDLSEGAILARKEGISLRNPLTSLKRKRREREDREVRRERHRRQNFRIPGKVKERRNCVKDELSDLTMTFNEMSDELMLQYSRLEERVQQRTAELELSKKAAEAANESKTLFIANISHELKTPLNGILGMAALCMGEDDPERIKRSIGIIYKSGDLLLNLLTDLLTFSKNQVGQQLSLDEKEFRLRDVSTQILAIFDKQAKEGNIDLKVQWEGVRNVPHDNSSASPERTDFGPNATGRLKDMIMWGDVQRILQVVINLVSNSLKFTPPGGEVVLIIRCLPEVLPDSGSASSRKASSASRQSRTSRQSRQVSFRGKGSESSIVGGGLETANAINAKDKPNAIAHLDFQDRAPSPPPGTWLSFEFVVTDTGPGIPEDIQQKIFEPFVQGDLGLSKKYGGTGLGLSICSQLAGLMRGKMDVKSLVGFGSTFTMKIPLRHLKSRRNSSASSSVDTPHDSNISRSVAVEATERLMAKHGKYLNSDEGSIDKSPAKVETPNKETVTSDSQPRLVGLSQPYFASSTPKETTASSPLAMEKMAAEAKRSGNRIRVLVAEDNKVNQEVVLRMLKLEDIYDVTVAKDGQEALDMVKESMTPNTPGGSTAQPFNLIFMDVQMPNVDGLQSTKMIREIGYQAPIVALTAFAEESNIKDCYDSGMNYFL